jgi:hypothetical protein
VISGRRHAVRFDRTPGWVQERLRPNDADTDDDSV